MEFNNYLIITIFIFLLVLLLLLVIIIFSYIIKKYLLKWMNLDSQE